MLLFNQNFGYLEGLVRGFKNGLLNHSEYQALTQCDSLEDLKIHLSVRIFKNNNQYRGLVITPEKWLPITP